MALTDKFNGTNPDFFNDIYDDDKVLETVRKIEERRFELAKKLEAHCEKHREQWVVRQAARLHEKEKMELNYDPPKPHNSKLHQLPWNKNIYSARRIVDMRIFDRMFNLNTIAMRMQQDVVMDQARHRHQNQGMARQRLDHEVKEIHQTIHRQRMDAYRDFEANKIQRVEEARKNLSQTPERDVYESYKQQDIDILTQKEHLLTQTYEKHGFNYQMEKHALTQKFTQKL